MTVLLLNKYEERYLVTRDFTSVSGNSSSTFGARKGGLVPCVVCRSSKTYVKVPPDRVVTSGRILGEVVNSRRLVPHTANRNPVEE